MSRVDPELAADPLLTPRQRYFLVGFALVAVAGVAISPVDTAIGLMALVTAIYSAVVIYRAMLFVKARRSNNTVRVSDEDARAVPDADLPIYTILVPAYREPEVIGRLVANLSRLEYPHDRLDVKFLLEEDDAETISAVANEATGSHMEAVIVPPGGPRTKPKALNFGLSLAQGEVVTIYDAEDQPEPLQLRRSAIALIEAVRTSPACRQNCRSPTSGRT